MLFVQKWWTRYIVVTWEWRNVLIEQGIVYFGQVLITKQIQDKVAKCQVCNRYRNKQVKEPLMPHQVPDQPWQILAADMFVLGKDK
jgi:hypothetical protein